jgi:hypothetical protein
MKMVSPQNIMRAGRDAAAAASSSPELSSMTGKKHRAGDDIVSVLFSFLHTSKHTCFQAL